MSYLDSVLSIIEDRSGVSGPSPSLSRKPFPADRPSGPVAASKRKSDTALRSAPPSGRVAKPDSAVLRDGLVKASSTASQAQRAANHTKQGPAPIPSTKPPAKNSYAAMLEQAKKAQEEKARMSSTIKHHKTEKVSRAQKLARRAALAEQGSTCARTAAAGAGPSVKGRNAHSAGGTSRGNNKLARALGVGAGKRSGAPATGAGGSVRKKPIREESSYTGTMRPSSRTVSRSAPGSRSINDHHDYDDDDDDDDPRDGDGDDGEGDGVDDYSDASSDMEAGYDDIENEEMASARTARKEDEEALAEENALRAAKSARRKKLRDLQDAAAAKRRRMR